MQNELATTEPLFHVGFCINSVTDEFEIVCILTDEEECRKFLREELRKPFRMGISNQQHLTMGQIKEVLMQDVINTMRGVKG